MPLPIYRLRRWLLVIAVMFIAVIASMYFYARMRQRDVLKEIPNKLGFDIKQTASGFQFSKSDGKRTLFTIEASDLRQFKLDGSAELHNVNIVLYGRDSSRFDQVYGDDFTYDKKSGNVTARGEVQIDLEANPAGKGGPDQVAPKELKNPIHLKTQNLVFNQTSGDASTDARVDFRTPQATGWAVGMQYAGKSNTLTLDSQIHITLGGEQAANLVASHGIITRDPREVVLDHPQLTREIGTAQSDHATFFLGPDNEVQRVLATGNVNAESAEAHGTAETKSDPIHARADEAEMFLTGKQNILHTATLTGNVHIERNGSQPMRGDAGKAILDFVGQNQLKKVHAMEGVRLAQRGANIGAQSSSEPPAPPTQSSINKSSPSQSPPQDFEIAAPIIDFFVADGRHLDHAYTSGPPQIIISPEQTSNVAIAQSPQRTLITAGRFDAKFAETSDGKSRLTSLHGAPNAKIVNVAPGVPDRISTSYSLDAAFLPEGGIASIIQQGSVAYTDGLPPDKRTQAWAEKAVYTPTDRILLLTGSPRVTDGGMLTTATAIRINHDSDDAFAEGNVKSTYSELKEQPNGALLASASPIHVTAASMTAHNSPGIALYQGNARLWQDANIIEAPSILFDRDHRSLVAQGTATQLVSTVLVQAKSSQPKTDQPKVDPLKADHPRNQLKPVKPDHSMIGGTPAPRKSEEKSADTSPVTISAARLTYSDEDRIAHYEGGVVAKSEGSTASSKTLDAYLLPRSQTAGNQQFTAKLSSPGQLDHMIAQGSVVIVQPNRRAQGDKLVYTASDEKFVLTGGPPSIFDAEQGKITGVSLTFFRADDRVLVEGEASTPVVTQTRVAR